MYSHHAGRRARLLSTIGDAVAVLPTAPEQVRNADCLYPFRADSSFIYLTGFAEPEAVLVLDGRRGRSILFCRDKNPDSEIWDGFRYGPDGAREAFGFDEAYSIAELDARLPELIANVPALLWNVGRDAGLDARVAGWLGAVRARARQGVAAPARYADLAPLLDAMRVVKDEAELDLMRRAGQISAQAHVAAMRACRPGMHEYQIEAELIAHFMRAGARHPAYESIVAGGANACTLHYAANDARLVDGELLLIDAGCELAGYASDITRTFPVNGRFSGPQRAVYELVLAAEEAAIATLAPGVAINAPQNAALGVLVQGLVDLGLLQGSVDGLIESGAYRQFYMHGVGHFIGLDVHDVGRTRDGDAWLNFQAGMCTTIEPGLYLRPAPNVPEAFHHIGVRIEDDVIITDAGCEVYTAGVPKRVDEIEALMRDGGAA